MVRLLDDPERLEILRETKLLDEPSQEALDRFVRIARAALGVTVSLVSLVDDHRQFFTSAVGLPEPWASNRETPLSHSFCKHVVQEAKPLIVEDARLHPTVRDNLAIPDLSVIAYAGMPVGTKDQVLGSLCAIDSKPRAWSDSELGILAELADAVSAELELRRRATRAERSEHRLAMLNDDLTRTQKRATQHTASMVHDLRTPLGVVSLGVQSLQAHEAARSFPELGRLLGMMKRNVEHATSLLSSTQGPTGPAGPRDERKTLDLAAVAREVCADLRGRRPAVELDLLGSAFPIPVRADATEIRRCFENLLSNAERFARSRIAVGLSAQNGQALVSIEDDGPGLPDLEAYRRAWEASVRFHVEDGRSGTGLGLSIVKEIVERAGGHVRAERSDLGGARFVLAWPAAEV